MEGEFNHIRSMLRCEAHLTLLLVRNRDLNGRLCEGIQYKDNTSHKVKFFPPCTVCNRLSGCATGIKCKLDLVRKKYLA